MPDYSTSFADSSQVEKLENAKYRINLSRGFCIGAVPNGGYTASCVLAAGSAHLGSRNQPDMLTAHVEYLDRASPGPGIVTIEPLKLGRRISLLQLTLWQDSLSTQAPYTTPSSRRVVLVSAIYTNLAAATGLSIPTGYEITPAAALPPHPDAKAFEKQAADENWREEPPSGAPGLTSVERWQFYMPRGEPREPGVLDMWIRLRNGEKITQKGLPFALDSFPHTIHSCIVAPELRELMKPPKYGETKSTKPTTGHSGDSTHTPTMENKGAKKPRAEFWFPTVVMNYEIKKKLPDEGVEWLHARISGKQIKDGRADMDYVIRDIDGDLVAQAQQVYMIVSAERNRKGRDKASL
ncbi:thioesterase family protein [Trichoderma barbatum]